MDLNDTLIDVDYSTWKVDDPATSLTKTESREMEWLVITKKDKRKVLPIWCARLSRPPYETILENEGSCLSKPCVPVDFNIDASQGPSTTRLRGEAVEVAGRLGAMSC